MKGDLTKNYIYAVVRHLPRKVRKDVEKELDGLISEMLEVRCGNNPPAEGDLKAVLTELGTPEELAAKYAGSEQKFLISGVYFINYKRILKLVLPIVAGAVLLGMTISAVTEIVTGITGSTALFVLRTVGQTLGGIITGAFHAFGIITIIFALMERFKANMNSYGKDFLDILPEAPQDSEKIGIGGPIFGIIMSVAVAVLFLAAPLSIGVMLDGVWIPLFDPDVLRSLWPPILLWVVLGILTESMTLMEGRYTVRLAAVSIVSNLLIIGCAAVVFLRNTVMNPYFIESVRGILSNGAEAAIPWLSNPNILLFAVVCVVAVIESAAVSVKARKYAK